MDKQVIQELEKGNKSFLRYAVNRIRRIKKCIDNATLQRVINGEGEAIELSLRKLLLYNWDGPVVRFMDSTKQRKVVDNERLFKSFVVGNREWVDPNTQVLAIGGDEEGLRMAVNQIHYKSIKGGKKVEYVDVLGARSYVKTFLGKGSSQVSLQAREELHTDWKWWLIRGPSSELIGIILQSLLQNFPWML